MVSNREKEAELAEELYRDMCIYGYNVNVSRAFPSVYDGFKPIARRIITSMYDLGLYPNKPPMKVSKIVGQCMGAYHPHGDASIADALVRLGQWFSVGKMIVEPSGAYGSITGDEHAAIRYISGKMTDYCKDNIEDFKTAVNWVPNYDESEMEPELIPVKYPNLLIMGSVGIGLGFATGIPVHNFREVCELALSYIENKKISLDEMASMIAPDFPTGGICINGKKELKEIYKSGNGVIKMVAKTEITSNGKVLVTEIPYGKFINDITYSIQQAIKNEKIQSISSIDDNTNKANGVQLIITPKAGYSPHIVEQELLSGILANSFTTQLICVDGLELKKFNIKEIIAKWYEFRVSTLKRIFRHKISVFDLEIHKKKGILKALKHIDEVIALIKGSKNRAEAEQVLIEKYDLTEIQASHVAEIKLYILSKYNTESIKQEIEELEKQSKYYKHFFTDPKQIDVYIMDELKDGIKKYGTPRKTVISEEPMKFNADKDDMSNVSNEDFILIFTNDGYIKKIKESAIRTQKASGTGRSVGKLRDNDYVKKIISINNRDELFCFTNKGILHTIKIHLLPTNNLTTFGTNINSLFKLSMNETVVDVTPVQFSNYNEKDLNLVFCTKKGFIKRTPFSEYTKVSKRGLIAIKLTDNDEVISVKYSQNESDRVAIIGTHGTFGYFEINEVSVLSRGTRGIVGLKLKGNEEVSVMEVISKDKLKQMNLVSVFSNGLGKKTKLNKVEISKRGKIKGIIPKNYKYRILKVQILEDNEEMFITNNDSIIRINIDDIKEQAFDAIPAQMILKSKNK